jgi:hypothetical protein
MMEHNAAAAAADDYYIACYRKLKRLPSQKKKHNVIENLSYLKMNL